MATICCWFYSNPEGEDIFYAMIGCHWNSCRVFRLRFSHGMKASRFRRVDSLRSFKFFMSNHVNSFHAIPACWTVELARQTQRRSAPKVEANLLIVQVTPILGARQWMNGSNLGTWYDLLWLDVAKIWKTLDATWYHGARNPICGGFPDYWGVFREYDFVSLTGQAMACPSVKKQFGNNPCGNNPRVPRSHDWITCGYLWFVGDQHLLLRWVLSWYLLEFLWPSNSFWYPKEMLHLFGDDTQALCIWYAMQSGCLWPMAIRLVFRRTGPGIEVNDGSWGVLKTCDAIYSIGLSIYHFINRLSYNVLSINLCLSISIYIYI